MKGVWVYSHPKGPGIGVLSYKEPLASDLAKRPRVPGATLKPGVPVTLAIHITLDPGQTTASLSGATLRYTTIDGLPYQAVTNSVTGFVPNDHTRCR